VPLVEDWGVDKPWILAGLTPIVIGLVWLMLRRIRAGMS
jgi:uncharacterized membrane-anchored protein